MSHSRRRDLRRVLRGEPGDDAPGAGASPAPGPAFGGSSGGLIGARILPRVHVVLVLVMALGTAGCGPAAPTEDELTRLDGRLADGAYEEVLAEVTALEARTAGDDADTRRELELLRVLAEAGRGDCRPVADLIRSGAPGVSERRLAHVVATASDLALSVSPEQDAQWWDKDVWRAKGRDAWQEQVDASRCLLEEARERFPDARERIDARLESLELRAADASFWWDLPSPEIFRDCY